MNFIFVGERNVDFFSNIFWGGDGSHTFTDDDPKVSLVNNAQNDPLQIAEDIVTAIREGIYYSPLFLNF